MLGLKITESKVKWNIRRTFKVFSSNFNQPGTPIKPWNTRREPSWLQNMSTKRTETTERDSRKTPVSSTDKFARQALNRNLKTQEEQQKYVFLQNIPSSKTCPPVRHIFQYNTSSCTICQAEDMPSLKTYTLYDMSSWNTCPLIRLVLP